MAISVKVYKQTDETLSNPPDIRLVGYPAWTPLEKLMDLLPESMEKLSILWVQKEDTCYTHIYSFLEAIEKCLNEQENGSHRI